MPLTDQSMLWETFLTHQIGTQITVTNIRFRTQTIDGSGIRQKNADIMKHGGLIQKGLIQFQFRMPGGNP